MERAFEQGSWPESAREVRLMFDDGQSRTLQVRARFTRRRPLESDAAPPEEFCVVFLEDLRSVQSRSRQEKPRRDGPGVGRHRARNSQPAGRHRASERALLEDVLSNEQHYLARMVADNVDRLKRIVDDVMEASPGASGEQRVLDASALVLSVCTDWARTVQLALGEGSRLQLELPDQPLTVNFDPDHLRRVWSTSSTTRTATAVTRPARFTCGCLRRDEVGAVLAVASDGAAIAVDVERHLFEPFFSTRSRGTGLGLYICRELCVRHGASIEFRPLDGGQRHSQRVSSDDAARRDGGAGAHRAKHEQPLPTTACWWSTTSPICALCTN